MHYGMIYLRPHAEKVCGPENRDGFIRATLASRNKIHLMKIRNNLNYKLVLCVKVGWLGWR